MNSKQLCKTVNNINLTLYWADFIKENPKEKKTVEKYKGFTYLEGDNLQKAIETIKKFDINKIWDKKFMGLSLMDSICAVSSELSKKIKRIKQL